MKATKKTCLERRRRRRRRPSLIQPMTVTVTDMTMQKKVLILKLRTFCDVEKRVDLRKNVLFGGTSLVKAESLYAYYNAMLIQRINFLDRCVGG